MTRAATPYAAARKWSAPDGYGVTLDPVAGFYAMRLVSGGVRVGIHIWHGPPHDPDTGEVMDRSHRWQAKVNERPIDLDRVWPQCARESITPSEYIHLAGLQRWAEDHAPDTGMAKPTRRLDPLQTPMVF